MKHLTVIIKEICWIWKFDCWIFI